MRNHHLRLPSPQEYAVAMQLLATQLQAGQISRTEFGDYVRRVAETYAGEYAQAGDGLQQSVNPFGKAVRSLTCWIRFLVCRQRRSVV